MTEEENQYEEIMEIQENIDSEENEQALESILKKTKELQEKQEVQKYILIKKEQQLLKVFQDLNLKKHKLLNLATIQYNEPILQLDIGLYEQFQALRETIQNQFKTIQKLKSNITKHGLSGVNNDTELIQLKNKRQQMENELLVGKKFSSTQFVRDYLERPQVYRVSYEDVKYEYEMRLKVKQSLENQKQAYEKKKQQMLKAIKKEKALEQQLQQQRDQLMKK